MIIDKSVRCVVFGMDDDMETIAATIQYRYGDPSCLIQFTTEHGANRFILDDADEVDELASTLREIAKEIRRKKGKGNK